jgi:hypothetical protein
MFGNLHMEYPSISFPLERGQVIMEIIFNYDSNFSQIKGINRCRGALEAIFLPDITMVDRKYLEHFVFDPGGKTS